jgi:mRNA-degrading endonuclease toxin of MazEF toxin-antitoxin module
MAAKVVRGEVWIVDLGMVAKIRPCLVLSLPNDDENDRVSLQEEKGGKGIQFRIRFWLKRS